MLVTELPERVCSNEAARDFPRTMRDILPIAHFECLQKANWETGEPALDVFAFCERVYPVREMVWNTPLKDLMQAEYIQDIGVSFANSLGGCTQTRFRNPKDWQVFLDELTIEFSL